MSNEGLIESANDVKRLVETNMEVRSDHKYFEMFMEWKEDDAEKMQIEIISGVEMLEEMKLETENDEADVQWNHGVRENIRRMSECREKLASFSPPK